MKYPSPYLKKKYTTKRLHVHRRPLHRGRPLPREGRGRVPRPPRGGPPPPAGAGAAGGANGEARRHTHTLVFSARELCTLNTLRVRVYVFRLHTRLLYTYTLL